MPPAHAREPWKQKAGGKTPAYCLFALSVPRRFRQRDAGDDGLGETSTGG
jgi:hypothetical protein